MKRFFLRIFTLNNWKRLLILISTISLTIGLVSWGSVSYVSKNPNKSVEFSGGAEARIQVSGQNGEPVDEKIVENVQVSLSDRLTGGTSLNGTKVTLEGEGKILVSRNGISTNEEKQNFINEIINKPNLSITDINGRPLFYDGKFVTNGSLSETGFSWAPPLKPGGASSRPGQSRGTSEVLIELKDSIASAEWSKATDYISRSNAPVLVMWLNLKELIKMAEEQYPQEWANAGHNPYNFVYIKEKPQTYKETIDGKEQEFKPELKKEVFDASKYMLSAATVRQALSGTTFTITGNFSAAEAAQLALNLNYGSAEYTLKLLSSNFIPAQLGAEAFDAAIMAGIIAFSIIAIFMIANYGLLGALSTISLALYVFLTLLFFTIMRGEYSPATIAALVIGLGMSVDANVLTFERLKNELYSGNKLFKAQAKSNNLSLGTILNSNVTTFLVAVILFYFGTSDIKGFSITLILSILFTLIITLLFTRMLSTLLIRTGYFNKRLGLLGIQHKYIEKIKNGYVPILERPNYIKYSKSYLLVPVIILLLGIIIYVIFSVMAGNAAGGFVKSIEFSGGTNILIESNNSEFYPINGQLANQISQFLVNNGVDNSANQIAISPVNAEGTLFNISIQTTQDLTDKWNQIQSQIQDQFGNNFEFTSYAVSSIEAQNLVKNALLAVSISLLIVVIYTLFALKWTFSIAAILALLQDIVMVVILFVIFRLQFSLIFIAAALSIIGYSINNTIVTFDRIKEVTITQYSHIEVFDRKTLKEIANASIKNIIKRSLLTALTTLIAVIVLIIFRKSTDIYFNLALMFGLVFGTFSSLFIAPQVWIELELLRNKWKKKRIDKNYWKTQKIREQTFKGINDFQV
ncbi:protein translocase subunit SecDF [Mycoplasma iguanae]|uniref:Protein translocase subunit SecDF n=1 Tax=Mycoplasma iguanae TaxID=292461 RepID=A0ABY5R9M4_9MOLU|nr:protein translocase subunit SecDF [Mycoplasma iguanae]UVD81472.1 protein translocase subunit SecDF [Mycoplasma iguanae]